MMLMNSCCILIPAYSPAQSLLDMVLELETKFSGPIIIVDDGSGLEYDVVFAQIREKTKAEIKKNYVNLGKGAALKHGINHILLNYPQVKSIVTADADGQHAIADILHICETAIGEPDRFVLGVRKFGKETPLRSLLGNKLSKIVYRFALGISLSDTQTGLRAIPRDLAKLCLSISSNRYEFETEMLVTAKKNRFLFMEESIQTIYEDQNASSHFNPLIDSARIYFVILRYASSSIVTFLVDLAVFSSFLYVDDNIILANISGRFVALFVQFYLLKHMVFQAAGGIGRFFFFVSYVMILGLVAGVLQVELSTWIGLGPIISKIGVEILFFIFNFLFLRDILFTEREKNDG